MPNLTITYVLLFAAFVVPGAISPFVFGLLRPRPEDYTFIKVITPEHEYG